VTLETVVIQVGFNHRRDKEPPVQHLMLQAQKLKSADVRSVFVGVLYSLKLPGNERMQLDALNRHAQMHFSNYVQPLHPYDVIIQKGDRYGIHFNIELV
jgi:hypothetical protein